MSTYRLSRITAFLILLPAHLLPAPLCGQGAIRAWEEVSKRPSELRAGHACVVLGGKIWLLGGENDKAPLSSVEVFDPVPQTWSSATRLKTGLTRLGAVAVGNRLFCVGGENAGKATAEVHELVNNVWVARASMQFSRSRFALVQNSAELLVFGGQDGNKGRSSCEAYLVSTDKWRSLAGMPGPRFGHSAQRKGNLVYVFGGHGANSTISLRSTWIYDIQKDSWKVCPSPACDQILEHVDAASYVDPAGEIVLAGGSGKSQGKAALHGRSVERLDLSGTEARWAACTPLFLPLSGHTVCTVAGVSYLMGGTWAGGNSAKKTNIVFRSRSVSLPRVNEGISLGIPIPSYVVHPPLDAKKPLPVLVFGHGLGEKPGYYQQLMGQFAAMGFFCIAPDLNPLLKVEHFALALALVATDLAKSPKYAKFIDARRVFGGFSAGGGASVMNAVTERPIACFALAPWVGCIPSVKRCAQSPVIPASKKVTVPILMMAHEGDPLGTDSNARWLYENLTAVKGYRALFVVKGKKHGGFMSGQGFADISQSTGHEGRVLQERSFRYLYAFLKAAVLDAPVDNQPVAIDGMAESYRSIVGEPSQSDAEIAKRFLTVGSPELFIESAGQPRPGAPISLGFMSPALKLYILLIAAPPARKFATSFGDLLIDPTVTIALPSIIPSSQLGGLELVIPKGLSGEVHLQAFGLDRRNAWRFSGWRRTLRL